MRNLIGVALPQTLYWCCPRWKGWLPVSVRGNVRCPDRYFLKGLAPVRFFAFAAPTINPIVIGHLTAGDQPVAVKDGWYSPTSPP